MMSNRSTDGRWANGTSGSIVCWTLVVLAGGCSAEAEPTQATPGAGGDGVQGQTEDGGSGSLLDGDGESCDGLDDDEDGDVDEGCACEVGTTQTCFPGPVDRAGIGTCVAGTQTCVGATGGEFASGTWGPCEGAVGPADDVCGDGVDSDCDGSDGCDPGGGGAGAGGAGGGGGSGPGGAGGSGGGGVTIEVDLFLFGDCITATCPPEAPYPVGCNVLFTPGDDRGCVASTPQSSVVYFQAGDECDAGFVTGTLLCSDTMGAPLDAQSCPINKPVPFYPSDPSGCPETH